MGDWTRTPLRHRSRVGKPVGRGSLARLAGMWLAAALLCAPAAAQTLALTFDDGFDVGAQGTDAARYNETMLATLRAHQVRAMIFPAGPALQYPENLALVRRWGEAGHAIGNHTYHHWTLSKTEPSHYFEDILQAQSVLQSLPGWCKRLRFPYLDEGGSPALHQLMMHWLASHDYGVAAATIALEDWRYAETYRKLLQKGDDAAAGAFRREYLGRLSDEAQAQESRWRSILGRSPAHVLLLHTNALNTAVLSDLLDGLRAQGWRLIDADAAFRDPIYQRGYIDPDHPDEPARPLPIPAC